MKLDSLFSRYLKMSLSFPIEIARLSETDLDLIEKQAIDLGEKVYAFDKRDRTLNQCIKASYAGKLVEHCIYHRLESAELNVAQNEENFTNDYCWDLVVFEGSNFEKIEVKLLTESEDRKVISWNDKAKIANAMKHWEKFDYMVVCVMLDQVVYPWYLLDNQVWNPINDLFMDSKSAAQGVFIKTCAESRGFMKKLCNLPR